jgi:hypothetical protein
MPWWEGIKYYIKDIVACIYLEGSLCFCDRELNTVIIDIVAYIYVQESSSLGDRE